MGHWLDGFRTPFWCVGLAASAVVIFWFVTHSIGISSLVSPARVVYESENQQGELA